MKKILTASILGASLIMGNAVAAPIFVEANNVKGLATLNYGYTWTTMNNAPEFTFEVESGSFGHNLGMYTPGDYTIDFQLEGLWLDTDNDGTVDVTQAMLGPDPFSISGGPFSLGPLPPLSGSDGALSWNLDLTAQSLWLSYDFDSVFDDSGFSNLAANIVFADLDYDVSGSVNGVMDAIVGWDKMRIELNPVDVPEPSIWLLMGTGLLGLGWVRRRPRV